MWLILGVLITIYFIHQVFNNILPHYFLVPSQKWRDKILKVINYDKPIYLKIGWKRSSFRRRLILASENPSFYTNYLNNKLKIYPGDITNKDKFIEETRRRDVDDPKRRILYGFYHPYANNGGGGERVLWQAVKSTLDSDSKNICAIYTSNLDSEPIYILKRVENKFQISELDHSRIVFIYLREFNKFIDSSYWKHFTILGQFIGQILSSLEVCFELSPDVWVDTMGLPGSYFIASVILRIPIIAYVHYPVLQEDMFNKLKYKKIGDITNIGNFQDLKSYIKFLYWSILYFIYVYLGSYVDLTLANGTWTFNHMNKIWTLNKPLGKQIKILYPPCGTENLITESEPSNERENKLLYLAQFRPEKRHILILKEYQQFLSNNYPGITKPTSDIPTLIFAGSCRTNDDTATLEFLKNETKNLNLTNFVEFKVDISYTEVIELLSICKFGLNAMWNEHFGIGVVEYIARGCIPIVHASAGPYLDIVTDEEDDEPSSPHKKDWANSIGFFFKSFADPDFNQSDQTRESNEDKLLLFEINGEILEFPTLEQLLTNIYVKEHELISHARLKKMRKLGQDLIIDKFSNDTFNKQWIGYIRKIDALEKKYRDERRGKLERVY
ncbi:ALG11 [Candida pseudojiufengensis]|uniref:ALG11 n=1 Tax=Candida pseudojiufengensis TaxID=497109 RepID=UPI0022255E99|nr:ALG11 [Candida pseudojiufengensis]KAI5963157.1 ALG11 [Candida pseudojiufengensis]